MSDMHARITDTINEMNDSQLRDYEYWGIHFNFSIFLIKLLVNSSWRPSRPEHEELRGKSGHEFQFPAETRDPYTVWVAHNPGRQQLLQS